MPESDKFIRITRSGEEVPIFPELTHEQIAEVFSIADAGRAGRAVDEIIRLSGCDPQQGKLFVAFRSEVRKARNMAPSKTIWKIGG